jgi:hypothetical protein
MDGKSWRVGVLAALFALVLLCGSRVLDARGGGKGGGVKATDEGKAEDFKGKTFTLKEKGRAAVILEFTGGKRARVTVKSQEKTDVNLFIYDAGKKQVAKDDSPGPDCEINFTPKEDGKYTLIVVNKGPGENRSTLRVRFGKKGKPKDEE